MDPRDRADETLARARARGAFVITPDNATSPMDAASTVQIPRSVVTANDPVNPAPDHDPTVVLRGRVSRGPYPPPQGGGPRDGRPPQGQQPQHPSHRPGQRPLQPGQPPQSQQGPPPQSQPQGPPPGQQQGQPHQQGQPPPHVPAQHQNQVESTIPPWHTEEF
ncbi:MULTISPECIES: hypothetical protein [Actinoalloteichus]|uniref:Uncharacterized protein n=1 Tax=Actinoalloteichus fjordicus TaxID=1612552 RepID=A0AAC9PUQ8_9PSEU|nr:MULTISPECIES: hypothetical protein [Actinoalloteichus]APU17330.1 hypothetical protein UA74_26625 [Actinoalloteichus fjordicus]APU23414.1 hypothetical protein UA75_27215 [Actinoalloteichus sp. GBA129-24]